MARPVPTEMQAIVLEEHGVPLRVREVEEPTAPDDGVVVEACGICRSAWHAWQDHGEWVNDSTRNSRFLVGEREPRSR